MTSPPHLQLPSSLASFIEMAAKAPTEKCGLLIGIKQGASIIVDEIRNTPNIAADPSTNFEIDPATRLKTQRSARAEGREIVGLYHTHPKGEATPSNRDHAGAQDEPGLVWIIANANGLNAYIASGQGLSPIQPQSPLYQQSVKGNDE